MAKSQPGSPQATAAHHRPPRDKPVTLVVQNPHAAGIDVHSDNHVVCVPADSDSEPVRTFGANSCDLQAIANWLRQCGVTTVAMESTGVYWIPLFELLETHGFEVYLVEPGQLSRCGARPKTDVQDAQWIQRLHTYGLLSASFRPPDELLALRGYWRQRQMQVRYAAYHVQHMQKALDQMNVKLTTVISDITGTSGQAIISQILGGERDPVKLADLAHWRCKREKTEIAQALEGTWRAEHLFALQQAFDLYNFHQQQITQCDARIQDELKKLPSRTDKTLPPKKPKCGKKANAIRFDATGPLFKALGVDLTEIEGIDVGTALVILAEIGVDVSRFPTEKHFASWLGLCPRIDRSNKTEKKRSARKGKNRVGIALRLAARALYRSKSSLGSFLRRIKGRLGMKGAITATAHKLARLVYRMLKYGREYMKQSQEEYEANQREKQERWLKKKAATMGYEVVPKPVMATS
jgi:transposase